MVTSPFTLPAVLYVTSWGRREDLRTGIDPERLRAFTGTAHRNVNQFLLLKQWRGATNSSDAKYQRQMYKAIYNAVLMQSPMLFAAVM
jgi:hypothetical protein